MKSKPQKQAIGFVQQIPGGHVFEIGNSAIHRRIHCIAGRIGTTSLVNVVNGEEYLDETHSEFQIEVAGGGERGTLDAKDFVLVSHETPQWDDQTRTLKLALESTLNDVPFRVSVFYEVEAGSDFVRKWLAIEPCDLDGFVITGVTIENMRFKEMVEGVTPKPRYPKRNLRGQDNVHVEPDKADTSDPAARFVFGHTSRGVLAFWGYGEGLYFFVESLLGEETFYRPNGLVLKQRDCVPAADGLETGRAVIGAYVGQPGIGFKRCNEHLLANWCAVRDKRIPVAWNTWLVTLNGRRPLRDAYDRDLLVDYLEYMRNAGFYDVLRLDFGWEAGMPLQPDPSKFPNGLGELVRRASDPGPGHGYWVTVQFELLEVERGAGVCRLPGSRKNVRKVRRQCALRYVGLLRPCSGPACRSGEQLQRSAHILGRRRLEHPRLHCPQPSTPQ